MSSVVAGSSTEAARSRVTVLTRMCISSRVNPRSEFGHIRARCLQNRFLSLEAEASGEVWSRF